MVFDCICLFVFGDGELLEFLGYYLCVSDVGFDVGMMGDWV